MKRNNSIIKTWVDARESYQWEADLRDYSDANRYSNFFSTKIKSDNIREFEDKFRFAIENSADNSSYIIAGEVCFWKLYSKRDSRDEMTKRVLNFLSKSINWVNFCNGLIGIIDAENPSVDKFHKLRISCGMRRGFAVPITFLSFYHPQKYPMADQIIANWWRDFKNQYGYTSALPFYQDENGVILARDENELGQSWQAYLEWSSFCQKISKILSEKTKRSWRARDVEMAIFSVEKRE